MSIKTVLLDQGWDLDETTKWISVWDRRPRFKEVFGRVRVGKIIGNDFYVVAPQLAPVMSQLLSEAKLQAKTVKSTGSKSVEYVGLDTATIPAPDLQIIVARLAEAINRAM